MIYYRRAWSSITKMELCRMISWHISDCFHHKKHMLKQSEVTSVVEKTDCLTAMRFDLLANFHLIYANTTAFQHSFYPYSYSDICTTVLFLRSLNISKHSHFINANMLLTKPGIISISICKHSRLSLNKQHNFLLKQ